MARLRGRAGPGGADPPSTITTPCLQRHRATPRRRAAASRPARTAPLAPHPALSHRPRVLRRLATRLLVTYALACVAFRPDCVNSKPIVGIGSCQRSPTTRAGSGASASSGPESHLNVLPSLPCAGQGISVTWREARLCRMNSHEQRAAGHAATRSRESARWLKPPTQRISGVGRAAVGGIPHPSRYGPRTRTSR